MKISEIKSNEDIIELIRKLEDPRDKEIMEKLIESDRIVNWKILTNRMFLEEILVIRMEEEAEEGEERTYRYNLALIEVNEDITMRVREIEYLIDFNAL